MRPRLLVLLLALAACGDDDDSTAEVPAPPPATPVVHPLVRAAPPPALPAPEVIADVDMDDSDTEGIPDVEDRCPDAPDDNDGFEDTDGCPDPG
jgi:hypothetical protein